MTAFVADRFIVQFQKLLEHAGLSNRRSAISEAIPHLPDKIAIEDVFRTLDNLKLPYQCVSCWEREISPRECPAIVFPGTNAPYFAVSRDATD